MDVQLEYSLISILRITMKRELHNRRDIVRILSETLIGDVGQNMKFIIHEVHMTSQRNVYFRQIVLHFIL